MRKQIALLGVACIFMLGGCQQVKEYPADQAQAFAKQVEPEVENMLVGFSNKDYEMHTRDFDQDMLDTVDPVTFPKVYDEVIGVLGKYQSHALSGVQLQNNEYIVARYTAVFDNDSDVTVRVVFNNGDPDHKITGLWFDSKLLRTK
jgi:hypothetical protein